MKKAIIYSSLLMSGFLLTACAPKPTLVTEAPETLTTTKVATKTVSSWEIQGAMAAKSAAKGWSAAMHWQQQGPNHAKIRLMGPLGAGSVLIEKQGNAISFQDGQKRISSNNPDELLFKQTGIRLPVDNLYYWVRGMKAPGAASGEQFDAAHRLIALRQSGYQIQFDNYKTIKGATLPCLIRLQGNGVMVKVIIKNWVI